MSPPRAVLDSDILFSRVLHELMGRVAKRLELLDLVWSEELLAEARRSLVEKKGLSEDAAARWVGYLPQNFPNGETDPTGVAASIDLSTLTDDSDDHHVCQLAIASGAAYLAEWAGGRPINELLAAIERAGAGCFVGKVRAALGS